MLFNTIYNWIKYKTLPPSLLFRNRLFVERDAKHRRVMTNAGLSFRNSKWTSYSRRNISLKLSEHYSKLIRSTFFCILILTILFFTRSYYTHPFAWPFLDTVLSSLFFYYFLGVFFAHLLSYQLYNYFLNKIFTNPSGLVNHKKLAIKESGVSQERINLSPNIRLNLLYSWLENGGVSSKELTKLFSGNAKQKISTKDYHLIQGVYKTLSPLVLYSKTNSVNSYQKVSESLDQKTPSFSSSTLFQESFTEKSFTNTNLFLSYSVRRKDVLKFQDHELPAQLERRFKWNIFSNNKFSGNFYSPFLGANTKNLWISSLPELLHFNKQLTLRSETIRRSSWLYKYSNLNRLALKSSNILSNTKKLLGTGFYTYSLNQDNLWAANEINGVKNLHSIQNTLYGSSYGMMLGKDFLINTNSVANFQPNNRLTASQERSYLWFLKRAYLFSNTQNNHILTNLKLKNSFIKELGYTSATCKEEGLTLDALISTMLKSFSLTNPKFRTQLLNFQAGFEYPFSKNTDQNSKSNLYLIAGSPNLYSFTTSSNLSSLLKTDAYNNRSLKYLTAVDHARVSKDVNNYFLTTLQIPLKGELKTKALLKTNLNAIEKSHQVGFTEINILTDLLLTGLLLKR